MGHGAWRMAHGAGGMGHRAWRMGLMVESIRCMVLDVGYWVLGIGRRWMVNSKPQNIEYPTAECRRKEFYHLNNYFKRQGIAILL